MTADDIYDPLSHFRKSMSKNEKLKVIDELSLTIVENLGLQEKMNIIKIINPTANWNKQTEFVIGKTTR